MEDWVRRALARWPDVPALYGWLALDRRGRWRIRGEIITRPQIIETIDRNYEADEQGRWFFQNGPQRGYMDLEYAPWVLRVTGDGEGLQTHTGLTVGDVRRALLDEHGSLVLVTEHGPGLLADADLPWAMSRLRAAQGEIDDAHLAEALALPSGATTALRLGVGPAGLAVERLDTEAMPAALGFARRPQPLPGEKAVRREATQAG
jgi:hypothetical protein